jgi:hypothetical protein
MSFVVCPALPFPNIFWWSRFTDPQTSILLDGSEHFEKMTLRNRYVIAAADGPLTLSIPLRQGRQQRKPMKEVLICNKTKWQIQQERTLESAYRRAPFFEHYEQDIRHLLAQPFDYLLDFNKASIELLLRLLQWQRSTEMTEHYQAVYDTAAADIRKQFSSSKPPISIEGFAPYYQVFADRTGFHPNLSLLDLLFNEGPQARSILLATGQ